MRRPSPGDRPAEPTINADELIQPVLDRQHGLITWGQAQARGASRTAITHRARTGRLIRMHRGVYRAASAPKTLEQRALAAQMAAGPKALVSHDSAAMQFGLIERSEGPLHVTVPIGAARRIAGIVVHRARDLTGDTSRIGVIPVTSVPRTLVDIAASLSARELAEATDRALRRKLIRPTRLDSAVRHERFDRFRGVRTLREIALDRSQAGVPGSVLETDMIALMASFALPPPMRQFEVKARGRTVVFDLAYPAYRVAIELDGRSPHTEFETWQRDHNRHNATELAGWTTMRFTWWDVHETPVYTATTVADALGLRPARWKRHNRR